MLFVAPRSSVPPAICEPASLPSATLPSPATILRKALTPTAVFALPSALYNACAPTATLLSAATIENSASLPSDVLLLPEKFAACDDAPTLVLLLPNRPSMSD